MTKGTNQWKHRADKNRSSSSDFERVNDTKQAAQKVLGVNDFQVERVVTVPGFRINPHPDLMSDSTRIVIEDNGGIHYGKKKTMDKDVIKYAIYREADLFTIILNREMLKHYGIDEDAFFYLIQDTLKANGVIPHEL